MSRPAIRRRSGDEEAVRRALRSQLEQLLARPRLARDVLAEHVDEVERVRGRRHVGEIERRDAADVIEDAGELARKRLELVRLQRDMGERGCVAHVVRGQAHGA